MRLRHIQVLGTAALASGLLAVPGLAAQEMGPVISRDEIQTNSPEATTNSPYTARVADGEKHGLPEEAFAVVPGTKFLVSLEQELNTKELKRNQQFRVRTVNPWRRAKEFIPQPAR